MAIKKVWIEEECTACGLCTDICPEVFDLPGDTAIVIQGADYNQYENEIKECAEECPVEVIQYEED